MEVAMTWQNLWQVGVVASGAILTVHLAIETANFAWGVYGRQAKPQEVVKTQKKEVTGSHLKRGHHVTRPKKPTR
jgi:hypothetical protein